MRPVCAALCLMLGWGVPGTAQILPNLRVAPAQLDFTAVAEAEPPPSQAIAILTTDGSPFDFQIEADGGEPGTPPPSWLRLAFKRGSVPARLLVGVSAEGLAPGNYGPARLHVNTSRSLPAAPPVIVTLKVVRRAPELSVEPAGLRFWARIGGPETLEQPLLVRNLGSGLLNGEQVSIKSSAPWLRATLGPCAQTCWVRITVKTQGLRAGAHRGVLDVSTPLGAREIPVALYLADRGPWLEVNPPAVVFEARAGHGCWDQRSVSVLNAGEDKLNWSAETEPRQPWLITEPTTGSASATQPGTLRLRVNAAGVGAGQHYALVKVSSPEAPNSPQYLVVVLQLAPPDGPPAPGFSQTGFFFVSRFPGGLDSQPLILGASSAAPLGFQAATQVYQGASWLSVTPTRGDLSTSSPAQLLLAAGAGLPAGVYRGSAVFSLGGAAPRGVHLALIAPDADPEACRPASLVPLPLNLPDGFEVRAGIPAPLTVRVVDDCGAAASGALAAATFSSGDPAVVLGHLGNGVFAGVWTPRAPVVNMSVNVRAWYPDSPIPASGSTEVTGTVLDHRAPELARFGIVSNLYPRAAAPLAPGTIVQIHGRNLASRVSQPGLVENRLPDAYGGVSVLVGASRAPLYYLSSGQINAQIPVELLAGRQYQVVVSSSGAVSLPEPVDLALASPAIAAFADGRAIAQDSYFRLIDRTNPARPGDYVVIYLVGMGMTNPMVPSGSPAPRWFRLAECVFKPEVRLDGRAAEIVFAGLTPDFVGLYQINFRVPQDARAGDLKLVVVQEGVSSNEAILPVR